MLLWLATMAAGVVGCAGGPDSAPSESAEYEVTAVASGPSQSKAPGGDSCTTEGCPCDQDGATTTCPGPRIQVGSYTSCAPGIRACLSGKWGACIGKTLYYDVDSLTQDYVNDCPAGQRARWGALSLQGATPGDSRIDVTAQTAATTSGLGAAAPTLVGSFDGGQDAAYPVIDVGTTLEELGVTEEGALRLTLTLVRATSGASAAPIVMSWHEASTCASR